MAVRQFGTYLYDTRCVLVSYPDSQTAKLRLAETPHRDGQYTGGGLVAGARLTLTGVLIAQAGDDLPALWRAFKKAHKPGAPQALYLEDTLYYRLAEVESVSETIQSPPLVGAMMWEVGFVLADPFQYEVSLTGPTNLSTAGAVVIANNGDAPALPSISLVVFTGAGTITITNATTGQTALVLTLTATGTYVVDTAAKTVTRDGAAFYAYDGEFPRLDVGNNSITVALAGGAALTGSPTITYRERTY